MDWEGGKGEKRLKDMDERRKKKQLKKAFLKARQDGRAGHGGTGRRGYPPERRALSVSFLRRIEAHASFGEIMLMIEGSLVRAHAGRREGKRGERGSPETKTKIACETERCLSHKPRSVWVDMNAGPERG